MMVVAYHTEWSSILFLLNCEAFIFIFKAKLILFFPRL